MSLAAIAICRLITLFAISLSIRQLFADDMPRHAAIVLIARHATRTRYDARAV